MQNTEIVFEYSSPNDDFCIVGDGRPALTEKVLKTKA